MSLSNISIEQPPEGTDPALTEYLTRQAEQVSAVFTGADIFIQRHTMPLKYAEGTVINFGSAIDPDITEPGLWLYTNDEWVKIATGDTNVIPPTDAIPDDLKPTTLVYFSAAVLPEITEAGLWLFVGTEPVDPPTDPPTTTNTWVLVAAEDAIAEAEFLSLPVNDGMPAGLTVASLVYFNQQAVDIEPDITEPGLWMLSGLNPSRWVFIAPEEPVDGAQPEIEALQFTGITSKPASQSPGAIAYFPSPVGGSNPITNRGLWTISEYGWEEITVNGYFGTRWSAPQAHEKRRGLVAYFGRAVASEGIDQEGLYVYKSTGWAFIA